MATYIARNAEGELELAPTSESGDDPDPVQMEQALNELGVETR